MENSFITDTIQEPLFTPHYLNIEYIFSKIVFFFEKIIGSLSNSGIWSTVGLVSGVLAVFSIAVIIYSLVRIYELQVDEEEEINKKIEEALFRQKQKEKDMNPRWHYVLTLVESINDSDWRVAIMEADSMMEEILKEKGLMGGSVGELLEEAKANGYRNIQDAWDAHLVRNQIAHQGSDFPLTQVESRRVIKLFENFFQELGAI